METVFRSSFLLALTCSKRICFPPDTDSFLCVKEWGWSIWGPVPGGAGLTSYTGGGGAGRRNAAARPRSGRAFGACGAKASAPNLVYEPGSVLQCPGPALRKISFSGAAPKTKNRGLMAPVCHMLQESVATSTALMVCRRFSASSNTLLLGLSKTSSVTSRIS